ncbi:MAG: OB-fold nucleic acid binding domain-containing protein, partial [Candidatus Saccharimonas aalborgensis]
MQRTLVQEAPHCIGKTLSVSGWVHARRDHGGLIFVDVRDHSGILQLVINPENTDAFAVAEELRDEFVIKAEGELKERTAELKNEKIPTGEVELYVAILTILNRSQALPIQPFAEAQAGEDLRLKYRYL